MAKNKASRNAPKRAPIAEYVFYVQANVRPETGGLRLSLHRINRVQAAIAEDRGCAAEHWSRSGIRVTIFTHPDAAERLRGIERGYVADVAWRLLSRGVDRTWI